MPPRLTRAEYIARNYEFRPRGEQLRHAVLTEAQVRQIRAAKGTSKQLAAQYGVHYRTIEKVRCYETWRHVKE